MRTEAGVLTTVGLQELVDHDEGLGDPLQHGVHLQVVGTTVHKIHLKLHLSWRYVVAPEDWVIVPKMCICLCQ